VVVLGLLADGPVHGYDLLERARDRGLGFWAEVGKASVYQALRRLESAGAVAGRAQDGTEGPDRRVYRITKAGRVRFSEGLDERFGELAPYETEAGLALGFAHLLTPARRRAALDARERGVRDLIDALATEQERTAGHRGTERAIGDAMLERQLTLSRAELDWIGRFRSSGAATRR
jgi:DNA-binding PadR family transcriptional regulator